jgi:endogenous inhibitor of DNA gyrase (YacG/DUF329 family)
MPRCPVCNDAVDLAKTPTVPFCSHRCRMVDMGRWLGESYGVPFTRRPDDEEEDPAAAGGDDEG